MGVPLAAEVGILPCIMVERVTDAGRSPGAVGEGGARRGGSVWEGLLTAASVSRLHIVAIAVMGCLTFGWALTGERPWLLAIVCGLDWFVVNLLNRVVDLAEDEENHIRGTGFVARHRRGVLFVGFSVLALSLVATLLWQPVLTPFRLGYHALGFSYNWRILPGGRRIKTLFFFKNTASATGFLLTVFGYPLSVAFWGRGGGGVLPDVTGSTVLAAAGFFFLFELSYEVIYDLRDAPGDAAAGVRSYPVVYGERGAVWIIDGLLASSLALAVGAYLAGTLPWRIAIMGAAPLLQVGVYKRMLRRGITSADCIGITWLGVALLGLYHLWVVFDLPGARGS